MKVEFLKAFLKDINRLPDQKTRNVVVKIIECVEQADDFSQIPNLKKLVGFESAYRIRFGNFRIGIFIEGNSVEFARIAHRKDIYEIFP